MTTTSETVDREALNKLNTDRELWRERDGDYYADSVHVTERGGIGMNHGGTVIVLPVERWVAAARAYLAASGGERCPDCVTRETTAAMQASLRARLDGAFNPPTQGATDLSSEPDDETAVLSSGGEQAGTGASDAKLLCKTCGHPITDGHPGDYCSSRCYAERPVAVVSADKPLTPEQGEGVLNEAAWADCSIPLLTLKHGLGVASDGWLLYQMESTGGWRRWGSERGVDVRRELIGHLARLLAAARRDLAAEREWSRQWKAANENAVALLERESRLHEATQRDLAAVRRELTVNKSMLDEYQNDEASVCPEDVGFVTVIERLRRDLAAVTAERDEQRARAEEAENAMRSAVQGGEDALELIGKLSESRDRERRAKETLVEAAREASGRMRDCVEALATLPVDALGEGSEVVGDPGGEQDVLTWPLRDELIAKVTTARSALDAALRGARETT